MNKVNLHIAIYFGAVIFLYACASSGDYAQKEMATEADSAVVMEYLTEEEVYAEKVVPALADASFAADEPDAKSLRAFEQRAMQKVRDYADFIEIITNKTYDRSLRKHAREQASALFAGKDIVIRDTLLFDSKKELSAEKYFDLLFRGKPGVLSSTIGNIRIEESLQKTDSAMFRGTLAFEQTYHFAEGDKKLFSKRQVVILLVKKEKRFGDERQEVWEVMLGRME